MTELKIIPDFIMLFIGVGGLIFYTAIYLISGFTDHTLLAFSLVCGFYGLVILFILKTRPTPESVSVIMEQDEDERRY